MEDCEDFENLINIDGNRFLNYVAIYNSLIRYLSEEETIDVIETIEKSLDSDSINFRMGRKIKPYIFINGKTTVNWSWRLDKYKLSNVRNAWNYLTSGLKALFPNLRIPHPIYNIHLIGMYDFFKPKIGFSDNINKLNITKYSYAETELNKRVINLSNKIRTIFIDDRELVVQKDTLKKLPVGTKPQSLKLTTQYFHYFFENEVIRVVEKLYPNKLVEYIALKADKEFIKGIEVTSNNESSDFKTKENLQDKIDRNTCKVSYDGVSYINLLGLYKVCKRKEDADFIYNLILKNQQDFGSIDTFIFLNGYELVLKKKNLFNMGIPIDDDYSLLDRLSSKINKDIKDPMVALKFGGFYIYRNFQNTHPYVVPCEESYLNMMKVPREFQRNIRIDLLDEFLEPNEYDGRVLPQSTQFHDCEELILNPNQENYLYFFEGDIVKIVKKYFSAEDQKNFLNINPDRKFLDGIEDFEENEDSNHIASNDIKDVTSQDTSSYTTSFYNEALINYSYDKYANSTDQLSNEIMVENDAEISHKNEIKLSPTINTNFTNTVISFFNFIISFNLKDLSNEEEIYEYLFKKYQVLDWCVSVKEFMKTNNQESHFVEEKHMKLFITALVELVRNETNIRKHENKENIYDDYSDFRIDKAWSKSRITPFIHRSTIELHRYLK